MEVGCVRVHNYDYQFCGMAFWSYDKLKRLRVNSLPCGTVTQNAAGCQTICRSVTDSEFYSGIVHRFYQELVMHPTLT